VIREEATRGPCALQKLARNQATVSVEILHEVLWSAMRPRIAFITEHTQIRAPRRAPDEYYVIESANPKIQGFDGAVMSFVEYLYKLAK
jgi:hypothetical protein